MGVRLGSNGLTDRLLVRIVMLELSGPSILLVLVLVLVLVRSRRSISLVPVPVRMSLLAVGASRMPLVGSRRSAWPVPV
jgi:ABC-type dipeptide/oligopeptide/nickel transport system permease subunit